MYESLVKLLSMNEAHMRKSVVREEEGQWQILDYNVETHVI
jgi:hypothetical protein